MARASQLNSIPFRTNTFKTVDTHIHCGMFMFTWIRTNTTAPLGNIQQVYRYLTSHIGFQLLFVVATTSAQHTMNSLNRCCCIYFVSLFRPLPQNNIHISFGLVPTCAQFFAALFLYYYLLLLSVFTS